MLLLLNSKTLLLVEKQDFVLAPERDTPLSQRQCFALVQECVHCSYSMCIQVFMQIKYIVFGQTQDTGLAHGLTRCSCSSEQ